MTRNLYALLIGIDDYPSPVPRLQGCVNDIKAIKDYLQGRVTQEGYRLHLRTLLNQEATRRAVIDGFRQYLCRAGSEDVVLFYYAGHGSQEQAPEEFWTLEPDRLNETLVCYDSRSSGGWDLADKELGQLIAEVSQNNPHLVVMLDCCHSGSATRGELELETAVRKAPLDRRKRPLDSFLVTPAQLEQPAASRSLESNLANWTLPKGRQIFFSACRDRELAKEYNAGGERRGVFSYFLLDTLKGVNGSLTYRDLFKRTNALVRSQVTNQSPQIEATKLKDLDRPFLGGAIAAHLPYFTVSHHPNYGWTIDGGAVHGIAAPQHNETTQLALFRLDTPSEQLRQLSAAAGTAQVLEVMPHLSKVKISGVDNLQKEKTFKAVVTSLPLPPKKVCIAGEQTGVQLARTALQQKSSLYLQEVSQSDEAQFQLLARHGQYLIARPVDDRPLVASLEDYTEATAIQAIERLEHITRWENIAELASPATSRIPADAVQMFIYQNGRELQDTDIRLEYVRENDKWRQPTFQIKLSNTSKEPLYCALLDLTDRYAVSASLFATGGIWLQPGEEAWALEGQEIYATVDRELWERQGITEVKDILKLIVSTAEFDATLLEQEELDLPSRAMADLTPRRGRGTLNLLMQGIQSRALRTQPEEEVYDDWIASQIVITTVRPQPTVPIPRGEESVSLGFGVRLQSHPSLRASARLTTVPQSTRDVKGHLLPPILQADDKASQPFQFTASRSSDPGLSALELTEVSDPAVVTRNNPLKLIVETPLAAEEQLLPVAYDGEFFLPLGWGYSTAANNTEIILERLPEPLTEGERSLGGSIRIFFQKIISQKLKREFQYPILAVADVSADETVTYEQDIERVRERVARAERLVLYIHGIIGETLDMVRSVRRAKVDLEGNQRELFDLYDLVLAFDYENLHTPIEENARLLKQRLEAVGLGADRGKELHIVAHSMGGLVSRWFIEREGGDRLVQHLIMLGTPNAGSPWSKVQDWAVTVLALGLNGLAEISWPVPVLGILLRAIGTSVNLLEVIDLSLDQMQPDSEFLQNLAASPDPGVPYSIIAGNTSIVPAALKSEPGEVSLLDRLLQRLFNRAVALTFLGQPNDIAVTVNSIKSVNPERSPQPQIQEVGCDHMVYFFHPAGLEALAQAVVRARLQNYSPPESPTLASTPVVAPEPATAEKWQLITVIATVLAVIGWFIWQQFQETPPSDRPKTSQALVKVFPRGRGDKEIFDYH